MSDVGEPHASSARFEFKTFHDGHCDVLLLQSCKCAKAAHAINIVQYCFLVAQVDYVSQTRTPPPQVAIFPLGEVKRRQNVTSLTRCLSPSSISLNLCCRKRCSNIEPSLHDHETLKSFSLILSGNTCICS